MKQPSSKKKADRVQDQSRLVTGYSKKSATVLRRRFTGALRSLGAK